MFETNPVHLSDLIRDMARGAIQLPDFQRDWVWDERNIRELLVSVLSRYPVGAIMMVKNGGKIAFAARPIAGTNVKPDTPPDRFVLDGQQRLTSLFLLLSSDQSDSAKALGGGAARHYFVDIRAALGRSDEPMVVSLPANKKRGATADGLEALDLSTVENQYARHMIPSGDLLRPSKWSREYIKFWDDLASQVGGFSTWDQFDDEILEPLMKYQLPVITLDAGISREAICSVFEKVNDRGVHLTVFELLTAILAAGGFRLRKDWDDRRAQFRNHDVLRGITGVHFSQAVAMLSNGRLGCDRSHILNITEDAYRNHADEATNGFLEAARLLNELHVYKRRDLPYLHQIIALAIVFGENADGLHSANFKDKLAQWYWCGVFGGDYSRSVNSRIVEDAREVMGFVECTGTSARVDNATFDPVRLTNLTTRSNAAYKGVSALLLGNNCRDWWTDREMDFAIYDDERVDIHHIFPRAWCDDPTRNNLGSAIPPDIRDSIINKAPLTAKTNRAIGGKAPSQYLKDIEERPDGNKHVKDRLAAYHIDVQALGDDDFVNFYVERGNALTKMIHQAMGKTPVDARGVFQDVLRNAGLTP